MRTSFVEGPDGVRIAVSETGPSSGAPSVLFVHGIAQSRHGWDAVLEGSLARSHRLVAIDLRGHGDSDKPEGDEPYVNGVHFADDLHAVIQKLGLERPVVVAWSYGGVVVGDYLRHQGDAALGGLFLVAATLKTGRPARALFGPGMLANARGLLAEQAEAYGAAARSFFDACAAQPIDGALLLGIFASVNFIALYISERGIPRSLFPGNMLLIMVPMNLAAWFAMMNVSHLLRLLAHRVFSSGKPLRWRPPRWSEPIDSHLFAIYIHWQLRIPMGMRWVDGRNRLVLHDDR